jgi:hypothetical protein
MRENRPRQPHCVARTHHRRSTLAVTLLIRPFQAEAWRNRNQRASSSRLAYPECATRVRVCTSSVPNPNRNGSVGAAAAHLPHRVGGHLWRCVRSDRQQPSAMAATVILSF